jgi:sugar diacid utilization regulator
MVKELVAAQSLGAAGESGPVELDRIRDAHEMAARALAVARRQPEHIARYSDGRQLAHLVADSGASWAQAYLKPLSGLSDEERDGLLPVVRQVLHSGHGAAAEAIGLNRKTVAARWNRAGSVLRLDLRDMRVRAELNLALELVRTTANGTEPSPALSLGEILTTPVAVAWAQEFTAPLRRDARPLLRTVTAWISANGRIEECAERLDAHPNTVRNHLGACERLLGRRLVGRSGGANDLVIALLIQPAARRGR